MIIPKKLLWLAYMLVAALALPAHAAKLSPSSLNLVTGEVAAVKVSSIKGTLQPLANSNDGIATAVLSGSTITVTAVAPGTTTLSLADSKGSKSMQVTVRPPMTLSAETLTLTPKQSATVNILNPTGKPKLTNSSSSKVSASINGSSNTIRIEAKAAGDVTLTIRDSKTTRTIVVTVTASSSTVPGTVTGNTQGRLLASNCFQCHGTYGSGGFDRIMRKSDLADELNEFLSGGEDSDGIMAAHMKGYTNDQLQLIAAYLANP